MKFRFTAIDEDGRVLRGVLRAESEEHARDLLLSENVFAKTLEAAPEDEKTTWAPKSRIKERLAQNVGTARGDQRIVSSAFHTMALSGMGGSVSGEAGLAEGGHFVFTSEGRESLVVAAEDLEVAQIIGFPRRLLRLTLISGRMYEFHAGLVLARGEARAIVRHFMGKPGKGRK